jgi:hypothetical protein
MDEDFNLLYRRILIQQNHDHLIIIFKLIVDNLRYNLVTILTD